VQSRWVDHLTTIQLQHKSFFLLNDSNISTQQLKFFLGGAPLTVEAHPLAVKLVLDQEGSFLESIVVGIGSDVVV
jgi:hypothetical protein